MHCTKCGKSVTRQTVGQIVEQIIKDTKATRRIAILSPLVSDKRGEHTDVFARILKAGYSRVRLDGTIMDLEEAQAKDLNKQKMHSIEVVIDRLILEPNAIDESNKKRLYESVEKGLDLSKGKILVYDFEAKKDVSYSELCACPKCGISMPEVSPRSFRSILHTALVLSAKDCISRRLILNFAQYKIDNQ